MKQTKILLALMMLAVIGSCNDEFLDKANSRHIIISAELPDDNLTRASLTQKDGSLDMIAHLDEDDVLYLLVEQDGQIYSIVGPTFNYGVPISKLSENRKACTFEFDLREEIDLNRPYTLFGVIGMNTVIAAVDEKKNIGLAWGSFGRSAGTSIPLYFKLESGKDVKTAKFRHLTAYEVLHVTNTDNSPLYFHFGGFEAADQWYYMIYSIYFPDCTIHGDDNIEWNGYGPEEKINPGETKIFLSCYVPTGKKMKNARLRAIVNGNEITSSNTKSSDVNIEIGNAYHMYATWDGKELRFGKEESLYETDDYILSGDRKTLIKWKGSEEFVNMNSTPDLASIEIIGKEAFRELNTLKSIILPQGVKIIERDAFYWCKNVESISLPTSLLSIGIEAFGDCWKLKDITIPSSVEDIGKFAFYGCEGLTSLVIPNKVKVIGERTFYGCSNLKSITLSENLETIDEGAFLFCGSLESIVIPNLVRTIGVDAFSHCKKLSTIKLSNTLTMIGNRAFRECDIDKITIPQSVKDIGGEVFSECSRLYSIEVEPGNNYYCSIDGVLYNKDKSVLMICGNARIGDYTIPGTVNTIGDGAFWGCSSLTTITIPNSVKTIGTSAIRECSGLSSIVIPNSVTKLYSYAFYGCKKLTYVKLPESIETIPAWFCAWSPLKELEIPVNVKSIDRQAFEGCNLDRVKAYPILPPKMGWGVFNRGLQDSATLFVNDESLDAYKNAEGWNDFGTILPLEVDIPK